MEIINKTDDSLQLCRAVAKKTNVEGCQTKIYLLVQIICYLHENISHLSRTQLEKEG